jgi:hypothetical protein
LLFSPLIWERRHRVVVFWLKREKIVVGTNSNYEKNRSWCSRVPFNKRSFKCVLFDLTLPEMTYLGSRSFLNFGWFWVFFYQFFWLFEAVNRFIKVFRVPLRCFWVKIVLKNKFLGMKYPYQDFLGTFGYRNLDQ